MVDVDGAVGRTAGRVAAGLGEGVVVVVGDYAGVGVGDLTGEEGGGRKSRGEG